MDDDHLTSAEIEHLLLRYMKPGAWLALRELYDLVEKHADLSERDWEPDAPNSSGVRWHRNVRNVLQRRKSDVGGGGLFEWDRQAQRYRLA